MKATLILVLQKTVTMMSSCELCPIHEGAGINGSHGFGMMASQNERRPILMYTRWPLAYNSPAFKFLLKAMAEIHPKFSGQTWLASVIRCAGPLLPNQQFLDMVTCQETYFEMELDRIDPKVVVFLHAEAQEWWFHHTLRIQNPKVNEVMSFSHRGQSKLAMFTTDLSNAMRGDDATYTMFLRNLIGVWHASIL